MNLFHLVVISLRKNSLTHHNFPICVPTSCFLGEIPTFPPGPGFGGVGSAGEFWTQGIPRTVANGLARGAGDTVTISDTRDDQNRLEMTRDEVLMVVGCCWDVFHVFFFFFRG